jgi:transcriptional regulator with XRE-family HTH domain
MIIGVPMPDPQEPKADALETREEPSAGARSLSPTVRRLELANLLKSARTEAGQTLVTVAKALAYSAPTISRFESGEKLPREQDIRMLCRFLKITDEARVENLVAVLRGAENTGWWEDFNVSDAYQKFIGLESSATSLQVLESLRVPSLANVPAYAEAMWRIWNFPEAELEARRELLHRRQQILERTDPPALKMVIDEAALHRAVGGRDVMRAQVAYLADLVERPGIELRVIPFGCGAYYGQNGAFTILRLPVDAVEDTIYVDGLIGQFFFDTAVTLKRYEGFFESMWSMPFSDEKTTARLIREARGRW